MNAKRILTCILAVALISGLLPAAQAANTAHFIDVPAGHWAYSYVERAYADGAVSGAGGSPEQGTGIFSPNEEVTFAQFYMILANAFYPQELTMQPGDAWYDPALRVAREHGLTYFSEANLLARAAQPLDRYNAAYIVVKVMKDMGVALPDSKAQDAAAAAIADWAAVQAAGDTWPYYIASACASGVITGIDANGTFAGQETIDRSSAAVIYARLADKMSEILNDEYQIVYGEGWEMIPDPAYKEVLEDTFYEVFPRLWARWGGGQVSKSVLINVKEELIASIGDSIMWASWKPDKDGVHNPYVEISAKNQDTPASNSLPHELGHVVQSYYKTYTTNWWKECMADYARFRYYTWADLKNMQLKDRFFYQADEQALRDWEFEAYASTLWFFAYMDSKYPTTPQGYGLIDSIHYGFVSGEVTGDGPNDPTFNAVVQRITGYSTIEQLRQRYIQELNAGTWTFNGFGDYADNYITENILGVPNPTYPTLDGINLCTASYAYQVSGEASSKTAGDNLVDGDRTTRWEASAKDETEPGGNIEHSIGIHLGKPLTFDTYVLYNAGSQGNSAQNTVSWQLRYYDSENEEWIVLDKVTDNTQDVVTRTVDPVTTQYLWLEVLNSSGTGDGTVRLYELELYDRR